MRNQHLWLDETQKALKNFSAFITPTSMFRPPQVATHPSGITHDVGFEYVLNLRVPQDVPKHVRARPGRRPLAARHLVVNPPCRLPLTVE
jgi:hypothetical protein